MKKLLLSAVGLSIVSASFADFFPYDSLIVSRANGTTNAASTVDLVGYNFAGTTNGQVWSLGAGFTQGASATAEGAMNASNTYLSLAGYAAPAGTATPSGTPSTTWVRRVAVFNNAGAGSVAFTDLPTSLYSAGAVRSSFTDDGSTIYTSGGNTGLFSVTGGVATQLGPASAVNNRVVKTYNGTTYVSSAANGNNGVYSVGSGTYSLISSVVGTSASPYDFEFYSEGGNDYLFVADDRSVVNGGGLQVFKNGVHVRTFGIASLRSLGVRSWVDAGVPKVTVFGIANQTTLNGLTFDVGTLESTASTFSLLSTADAGTVYKSVVVVPEPASMIAIGLGIAGLAARRRRASK